VRDFRARPWRCDSYRHRSRRSDGLLHPRHFGATGAVRAADVSRGHRPRPNPARVVHPWGTAGSGGGAQLGLLAGITPGAGRGRACARMPASITGFVLPASVSVFRVATPITWLVGTLFLA